jgi:hypothetical protein
MSKLNNDEDAAKHTYLRYEKFLRFKSFLRRVKIGKEDECWEWKGALRDDSGYGTFWWPERHIGRAHVAAYVFFLGSIPKKHGKKFCVCHSCDNPLCVNPSHLWLGTHTQNMRDMIKKGRKADTHGELNPNALLDSDKVAEIHKLWITGKYYQRQIAKKFGITQVMVSHIVSGKAWKTIQ